MYQFPWNCPRFVFRCVSTFRWWFVAFFTLMCYELIEGQIYKLSHNNTILNYFVRTVGEQFILLLRWFVFDLKSFVSWGPISVLHFKVCNHKRVWKLKRTLSHAKLIERFHICFPMWTIDKCSHVFEIVWNQDPIKYRLSGKSVLITFLWEGGGGLRPNIDSKP